MPLTNNLKKQLDLPIWEWARFAPLATTTAYCTCTAENGTDRYIYYLGATFWRYDTWTDSWQQLATPNTAISTVASMRYAASCGFRTRALGSTAANTIVMAALNGAQFIGMEIEILDGPGKGQSRIVTSVSDPITADFGVVTTAAAASITDTTKKWRINQWAGYQCRLVYGAGASQVRTILYNDVTSLYFSDANYQAIDPWNNTGFSAVTPFAIPVNTAGAQTMYEIESSIVTVDQNWTIAPTDTSRVQIVSGGVWLLSSSSSAPFATLQYYDVARDAWYTRTVSATVLAAALATDCSMEKFTETVIFESGYAAPSSTSSVIYATGKNWDNDRWTNYHLHFVSGTNIGEERRVIGTTSSGLFLRRPLPFEPDTGTMYQVVGNGEILFASVGGNATLLQYSMEEDLWQQGNTYYAGVTRNISAKLSGYEPVGLTSITRNTAGVLGVSIASGGTGYSIGDILLISGGGGSNAKVKVTAIASGGALSGIELYRPGSAYTSTGIIPLNNLVTNTGSYVGSGAVNVFATGVVGYVTTAINHFFKIGDTVALTGFATDTSWQGSFKITGCDALTTFDIVNNASTASPTAANSQGASTIVDSSQNWPSGQLVGLLCHKSLVGAAGASEIRRITANTSTTLTLQSAITTAINGTSRYTIYDANAFGRDEQYKQPDKTGRGYATGGSTSALVDTRKNWFVNQWAGYKFRIMAGTGIGNEITILGNTSNTLIYATQTFVPNDTTKYLIMATFGLATAGSTTSLTDSTKNWIPNQFAGKRLRITSGTGQGQELTITSNTSNILTFATATAPGTDSTYTILSPAVKGAGTVLVWVFGNSNTNTKGKYIWAAIGGGSNRIDRYDIPSELWEYGFYLQPLTEVLTTGTMYAYDGADRIYLTVNATGRVAYLDLVKSQIIPYSITPYAHSTAVIGNKMEIIETEDGLLFLYILRHTGQEMWRTLLYL